MKLTGKKESALTMIEEKKQKSVDSAPISIWKLMDWIDKEP